MQALFEHLNLSILEAWRLDNFEPCRWYGANGMLHGVNIGLSQYWEPRTPYVFFFQRLKANITNFSTCCICQQLATIIPRIDSCYFGASPVGCCECLFWLISLVVRIRFFMGPVVFCTYFVIGKYPNSTQVLHRVTNVDGCRSRLQWFNAICWKACQTRFPAVSLLLCTYPGYIPKLSKAQVPWVWVVTWWHLGSYSLSFESWPQHLGSIKMGQGGAPTSEVAKLRCVFRITSAGSMVIKQL